MKAIARAIASEPVDGEGLRCETGRQTDADAADQRIAEVELDHRVGAADQSETQCGEQRAEGHRRAQPETADGEGRERPGQSEGQGESAEDAADLLARQIEFRDHLRGEKAPDVVPGSDAEAVDEEADYDQGPAVEGLLGSQDAFSSGSRATPGNAGAGAPPLSSIASATRSLSMIFDRMASPARSKDSRCSAT